MLKLLPQLRLCANLIDSCSSYPIGSEGGIADNFNDVAKDALRPVMGWPLQRDIPKDEKTTVTVVGAGYTGLSAALHLAKDKSKRVILLDSGRIGQGPSGKSAGHVGGLQALERDILKHCGNDLGGRIQSHAEDFMILVRDLIQKHNIPCDMRDGYLTINRDGTQSVSIGCEFGISPYPFVLGLAHAAKDAGVIIHEKTTVKDITKYSSGRVLVTSRGAIYSNQVVAAGGYRMAEVIPSLSFLRNKTTELRVTTIVTSKLPKAVIHAIMPEANGKRFPFCNAEINVAYGSINADGRLVFGAYARAFSDPNPKQIENMLHKLFPTLSDEYKKATGQNLGVQTLVEAEKLSFTKDFLPYVRRVEEDIYVVTGLGGHGIGAGVGLGKAVADKIVALEKGEPSIGTVFDDFASIAHGWLPPSEPLRSAAAEFGLRANNLQRKAITAWSDLNAHLRTTSGMPDGVK